MQHTKHQELSFQTAKKITAAVAACLSLLAIESSAAELNVPSQYATIQAAVAAAQTNDQVNVAYGNYTGNIVIDKPLSLVCDYANLSTTGSDPAITIAADDVWITGLNVTTTGSDAIQVQSKSNITIDFCSFAYGGVYLTYSKGATIASCNFYDPSAFGILDFGNGMEGGYADTIVNCQVYSWNENGSTGIGISAAAQPLDVRWNVVWGPMRGIEVADTTARVQLTGNYIHTSYWGSSALYLSAEISDTSVDLSGNTINTMDVGAEHAGMTLVAEWGQLDVAAHFNRFASAKAVTVLGYWTMMTTDLANNWWGTSSEPTSDISVAPWLVMTVSPLAATVAPGIPLTINVDWFTNSYGQNVSSLGTIPDGEDGYFWGNMGYFYDPYYGNQIPLTMVGGTSVAEYYTDGQDFVSVTLDYETVYVNINQ